MTNLEKIRSMSAYDLAMLLDDIVYSCHRRVCEGCPLYALKLCFNEAIEEWLNEEADNDND